jgi:hypothetical protein
VHSLKVSYFRDLIRLCLPHKLLHLFVEADLGSLGAVGFGKLMAVYELPVKGLVLVLGALFPL